jgi:hypothetical protein
MSVNTADSKSSLISLTEGEYIEERDYTTLNEVDFKYEDEKVNNLQLPTKMRRDLKNSVIKQLKKAKEEYFKKPT